MSRRTRLIATLLTTAGLVIGLAPAASAQPLPGVLPGVLPLPPGSEMPTMPVGSEMPAIETAPVWTPVIPGLPPTPVVTVPVPAPPRPAPEYRSASIFPTHNEVVGVAQPVMITFDAPVRDRARAEATIEVRSAPGVAGKFYWISDREVRWRPHAFWPPNTSVTVWVGGRERVFRTGDAIVSTFDNATKLVTVTRNGQVIRTMRASAGRDMYPTYNGVYYNGWRARQVRMDSSTWGLAADAGGYDVTVADGVRLSYDGIFVHSAPWSVADQGVRNVSHGCINLSPEDARWYFDTTRNGDPFIVRGTVGRQFGAFDGQGDWNY
jgi:lipoprotein-anchoring transpeptidase ErfK/SrfK